MVKMVIYLVLTVVLCVVLGTLGVMEQLGKAPWQKGKEDRSHCDDNDCGHLYESKSNPKRKKHSGKCDGDCANCPPHYGYRYGKWYYGHDHVEGCEFGGNKGSGGRD
ncbi:MAG: hypothetical protein J6S71_06685 [Clostridia bacterium]|nr:hypothetical protein [Clostridia bacterium]